MKLQLIKDVPLFAHCSAEEQRSVAERMRLEQYRKGETLFARGDPSRALYLIDSGWIKLVADGEVIIANLGPGSLVGEADLLLGQARSVDGQVAADVHLWTLLGRDLRDLIFEHPSLGLKLSRTFGVRIAQLKDYLIEQRLKPLPFLADLSAEELAAVADKLTLREYEQGDFIFENGQAAEAMFIIERGRVRLSPASEGKEAQDFVELARGEAFAEMALLTARPYTANAQALTTTTLWALPLEDFEQLTAQYPSIRLTLSRVLRSHLGPEDQAQAVAYLRKIPLFSSLPADVLQEVSRYLLLRCVPQGELVFAECSPGDALYIIESGEVTLVSDAASEKEVLAYLKEGDFFGEMALLTGKTRSMAAKALTDVNLWTLYRADFSDLTIQYPALNLALTETLSARLAEADQYFTTQHLSEMSLFSDLPKTQLKDIGERLRPVKHRAGDLILSEDQPVDVMYLIESGEVRVLSSAGQKVTALYTLGKGDFFGETSLLAEGSPSTMVQAISDVELWALTKTHLDELLTRYPHLAVKISRVLSQRLKRAYERLALEMSAEPATGATDAPPSSAAKPPEIRPVLKSPSKPRPQERRPTGTAMVKRETAPTKRRAADKTTARRQAAPTRRGATDTTIVRRRTSYFSARRATAETTRIRLPIMARKSREETTRIRAIDSRGRERRTEPAPDRMPKPRASTSKGLFQNVDEVIGEAASWFASRSTGGQLRVVGIFLLFIWLCGISAPVTVISAFSMENVNVRSMAFLQTVTPTPTNTATPTDTPTVTPTPTNTPIPTWTPTFTPTPPPTATPLPTDTPTRRPTPRPVIPTDTPVPEEPTATPTPDVDFRLVKVRKLTPCENKGGHNIYITVLDKEGNGIPNTRVRVSWGPDGAELITGKKPEISLGFVDFPMFKGTHSVEIMDYRSEVATGISPDIPIDEPCSEAGVTAGNTLYHYSFEVVFQRTW